MFISNQLHDLGRPQYQDVGAGRKVWTLYCASVVFRKHLCGIAIRGHVEKLQALYQTFDSEGVSDSLAIDGITVDATTKPIGFRSPMVSLRILICGRHSRIREVRQNIFRHIPGRPRSQRHEVVVRVPGLAHRPDLRCGK